MAGPQSVVKLIHGDPIHPWPSVATAATAAAATFPSIASAVPGSKVFQQRAGQEKNKVLKKLPEVKEAARLYPPPPRVHQYADVVAGREFRPPSRSTSNNNTGELLRSTNRRRRTKFARHTNRTLPLTSTPAAATATAPNAGCEGDLELPEGGHLAQDAVDLDVYPLDRAPPNANLGRFSAGAFFASAVPCPNPRLRPRPSRRGAERPRAPRLDDAGSREEGVGAARPGFRGCGVVGRSSSRRLGCSPLFLPSLLVG